MVLRTLRDPDAQLHALGERLVRCFRPEAAEAFARVLSASSVAALLREGKLVATTPLEAGSRPDELAGWEGALYEHQRLPLVSYPAEWSPSILAAAGELTLDLLVALGADDLLLKDASPTNVLFDGARPVFVDLPSIVARERGAFLWRAQDQFERCFLLPLLLNDECGIPIGWSLADPVKGVGHDQAARILGGRRWAKPSLLRSVALPAALTGAGGDVAARAPNFENDEKARYVLGRAIAALRRRFARVRRRSLARRSRWAQYTRTRSHYGAADVGEKRAFVAAVLERERPAWVLDVGANTGEFSRIAARWARVVALDSDEDSVTAVHLGAGELAPKILPLVANLARPSPATGWRNGETASLLERLRDRFDLVLMLAVVHHLRVTEGIPLGEILDLAQSLTRRWLLVESVPPQDPMFRRLARGREALYADCAGPAFERELSERFAIRESCGLANCRKLYLAERRR